MKNNIKKFTVILLVVLFVVASAVVMTSCGKKKTAVRDENVVQISYTLASFGDEWLEEAVELFNEAYKDMGYSAVIDRSDAGFQQEHILQEIKYPETNPYDLYITIAENIVPKLIDSSYSVLKTKDETLLEDLTDLYQMSPVATDGTEESGTVASTRNANTLFYTQYLTAGSQYTGKMYSYQWTSGQAGMAVNTSLLQSFGYDIPRTTNEMSAIFAGVMDARRSASTGKTIYPITWAGQNAAGYAAYSLYTWMAQWMGVEGYNNFFAMIPETGTTIDNGYDVYDNEGILYSLQAVEKFINQDYATAGTVTTIDHLLSDQILIDGEAIFSFCGSWIYNELISLGYSDEELSCIEMLPLPILSEMADQIGLSGTAEQKDAKLSAIVKGIDDGKSDAQIALDEGVTAAQVATVREARGVYFDLGTTHQAIIPSYSNAKAAAKEFLRFIASADLSDKVYAKYAHGITPNVNATAKGSNFFNSLSKITKQSYSTPIGEANVLSPIRMNGGINFTFEPKTGYPDMAKGMAIKTKGFTALDIYNDAKNGMRNNWDVILTTAGIYE